ncbi:MAG: hypothetical protein AAB353_07590, partial [Candidatus Hydrogenedentota bacterium]
MTRATETLRGILAGIACDYEIATVELSRLEGWLQDHVNLLPHQPFRETAELLGRVLEDQVVTDDEKEELIEWCHSIADPDSAFNVTITNGIRRLHG